MKKILFAAMAALAITSCSQNEIDGIDNEKSAKNLISFNSIVKKGARAVVADLPKLKTDGFNVYAYNTGTDVAGTGALDKIIINKEKVSYDSGTTSWGSENDHYWPETDNLQFYAFYAPKSSSLVLDNTATNKYPEIKDYVINKAVAEQEDLLVAKVENATKTNSSGQVTFTFSHALTQINFSVKPKTFKAGLTYTVTSMSISDVVNKGTYNYNTGWTPSTATNDKDTYTIYSGTTNITENKAVALNAEPFMLLPQTANATITVNYTVTDSKGQTLYTGTDKTVATQMAWVPNKNIRYTLELTDDITPLSFNVTDVNGWDEETSGTTEQ